VKGLLQIGGFIEPIYLQNVGDEIKAVVKQVTAAAPVELGEINSKLFTETVLRRVAASLELNTEELKRFSYSSRVTGKGPRPLYASTGLQIGLLENPNVPSLVPALLPRGTPAMVAHFLKRWIRTTPSYKDSDSMRELCRAFSTAEIGLPKFQPESLGTVVSVLSARQSNGLLFRNIRTNAAVSVLESRTCLYVYLNMSAGLFFALLESTLWSIECYIK
jgi:hypothetical protein